MLRPGSKLSSSPLRILIVLQKRMAAKTYRTAVKRLTTATAGGEEQAPEDEGAQHPEEQHAVLVGPRHLEVAEDQGEDEEVVDRQALLQQPRRRVLDPGLRAHDGEDDTTEDESETDPHPAPRGRLAEADDVCLTVGKQIDRQGHQDGGGEDDPQPVGHIVHSGPRRTAR